MAIELLKSERRLRQIVQSGEYDVPKVYSTGSDRKDKPKLIDGKVIYIARIDFHDRRMNPSYKGGIKLKEYKHSTDEEEAWDSNIKICDETQEPLRVSEFEILERKMQEIWEKRFPGFIIDAFVAAHTSFSGYKLFNINYDKRRTLTESALAFANELELIVETP